MNTGQYDREMLSELQSIDNRLANVYTEIQQMHDDQITHHEELIAEIHSGFSIVFALIVLMGTVKVLFRNA